MTSFHPAFCALMLNLSCKSIHLPEDGRCVNIGAVPPAISLLQAYSNAAQSAALGSALCPGMPLLICGPFAVAAVAVADTGIGGGGAAAAAQQQAPGSERMHYYEVALAGPPLNTNDL
eukprot:1147154-Pelagomonas_calceolata.AAC.5